MVSGLTHEKQQLHELVDQLAPSQVHTVRGIANAPVDDEPLTAQGAQALDEARDWLRHNRPIPHEQVLAELGITQEEIESYREPA